MKHVNYTYQKGEGGIAEALGLAEHFADGDKTVVILGDNILQKSIAAYVAAFKRQPLGAKILIKRVPDPERFGVVVFKGSRVLAIEEKPKRPKSDHIVIGVYMYDGQVFDIVKTLKPSARGELEITDVNNAYIRKGQMTYSLLKGWWSDCGTFESLHKASRLVAQNSMDAR